MSARELRKWYRELWAKYLAASTERERDIIGRQVWRVHKAITSGPARKARAA